MQVFIGPATPSSAPPRARALAVGAVTTLSSPLGEVLRVLPSPRRPRLPAGAHNGHSRECGRPNTPALLVAADARRAEGLDARPESAHDRAGRRYSRQAAKRPGPPAAAPVARDFYYSGASHVPHPRRDRRREGERAARHLRRRSYAAPYAGDRR